MNVIYKIGEFVGEKISWVLKAIDSHKADKLNPHKVTKAQVGLNKADNTSDADKPVSTAQREAIDKVATQLTSHTSNRSIHKTSEEIRSEIVDSDIPDTIARVTDLNEGLDTKVDKIPGSSLVPDTEISKLGQIEEYVKEAGIDAIDGKINLKVKTRDPRINGSETTDNTPIPEASQNNNGLLSIPGYNIIYGLKAEYEDALSRLGTPSPTWYIGGSLGPKIKKSGNQFELRNSADNDYTGLVVQDLVIKGNVTQEGQSFITKAETVEVADNTILLNKGEAGAGVTKGIAGIEIDRGTLPKYQFLYDESDDRFKIGLEGDLWPVLIRDSDEDLTNGLFLQWDGTNKKAVTSNYTKNIYFGTASMYTTIKAVANGINLSTINVPDQSIGIQLNAPDKAAVFTIKSGYYTFIGGDVKVSELKRISDNTSVVWQETGKQLMPSPSGTPSVNKFLCEDLTWKTVDVEGYLPLTAGPTKKLTGELFAPTLSITSTGAVAHLKFTRASYNYFQAPTGGSFAFVPNGGSVDVAGAKLLIHSNGYVNIGSGEEPSRPLDISGDVLIRKASEGLTIYHDINNPSAIFFKTGGISGTYNRGYLGVDGSADNVLKLQTLLKGTIAVEAHSGLSLFTGSGDISLNPNSSGGVVSLNSGLQINPKAGSYCEGIRMSTYGEWSAVQFASDKNAKTGFIAGQWVVGRNPGKGFTICQAGTETTAAIPTTGLGISPNNAGIYFNGATLLTGVGKQRIVGDGNILQLNSANNKAVHIDFMRSGVSKAYVGLGSDANEDVSISSYTANLSLNASNGIIKLLQKTGSVKYAGSWIQGKSGASIMYDNYNPVDNAAYNVFYGMKSVSGNVLTFGGIGDQIGFYGFKSDRTENSTDYSFYCNTITGDWGMIGNLNVSKGIYIPNTSAAYNIANSSGVNKDVLWMSISNIVVVGNIGTGLQLRTIAGNISHNRAGTLYDVWDAYNFNPDTKLTVSGGLVEVSRMDIQKTNSSDKISIQCYQDRLSISTNGMASTVGVNLGSLLVSNSWADSNKVPAFGIYTQGLIHTASGFRSPIVSDLNQPVSHFAGDKIWMIEHFTTSTTNTPGIDPNNSNIEVNDGFVLSQYWSNNYCFQLANDIDGYGIAYRRYNPTTGASDGWNFLATTAWVKSKFVNIDEAQTITGQKTFSKFIIGSSGGGTGSSSDIRFKHNRKNINNVLNAVLKAPSISYNWRDEPERVIGTVSQYWENIIPELVRKIDDKDQTRIFSYERYSVIIQRAFVEEHHIREKERKQYLSEISKLQCKVTELEDLVRKCSTRLNIMQ